MGSHQSITLSLTIREDLNEIESSILDHAINGLGGSPSSLPSHSYFTNRSNVKPLKDMYGYMADGQLVSRYWCNDRRISNKLSGVTLLLPHIKDPYNWEVLEFIDWIASLSDSNGFVGTMVDDLPSQTIILLCVFDRKLFFGNAKGVEVAAFSTGEKRTVGRLN